MTVDAQRSSARAGMAVARVPAKINLFLGVGPLRADGYHGLATVYHAIGLYDEVVAESVERPDAGGGAHIVLTVEGEGAGVLPVDGRNLAVAAALALAGRTGREPRVRLSLRKRIPVAGGLAGGSADAAGALVACDALWDARLHRDELAALAATLGSDVPFPLFGGTAIGTGRGEIVEPLAASDVTWHWVVAVADGGLSTPAVYAELDRLRAAGEAPPPAAGGVPDDLIAALGQDDPAVLGAALHNDLEVAALSLRPALRRVLDAGRAAGALAGIVSGSGPTCVFLAESAAAALTLARRLEAVPGCRCAYPTTGPVPGAEPGPATLHTVQASGPGLASDTGQMSGGGAIRGSGVGVG